MHFTLDTQKASPVFSHCMTGLIETDRGRWREGDGGGSTNRGREPERGEETDRRGGGARKTEGIERGGREREGGGRCGQMGEETEGKSTSSAVSHCLC